MSAVWQSSRIVESKAMPGVEIVIARMTFGRRLELMKRVRDLAAKLEYFEAGRDERNRIEASLLGGQLDRLYLEWGLEEIRALELDGEPDTSGSLIEGGPEELLQESLRAIKAECGLDEHERKN